MKNPALYYFHFENPDAIPAALEAIAALDPFASCSPVFDSALVVNCLVGVREIEEHLRNTLDYTFVLVSAKKITVAEWHPL
ncbi:MAG: hypothetical protein IKC24_09545 [Oscillospiraceae bacterium]|nr:hypothetical protein [Oscillospiraceae bacterium]